VRITVHVTPKAGADEVAGWRGDQLWVKVTAAPEAGKANAAVERTMASALGVPKSRVKVVRGQTSRTKVLEIDGVDDSTVSALLGEPGPRLF